MALVTAVLFVLFENVRSFVTQHTFPAVICNIVQTSSAAAWVSRFPAMKIPSECNFVKSTVSLKKAPLIAKKLATKFSRTSLSMVWSIDDVATASRSALQSSPLRSFGSWYHELDFRVQPPIYDDLMIDYSFASPTDTWPSLTNEMEETPHVHSVDSSSSTPLKLRRGQRPIRAIRRAAVWAFNGIPRPGRSL
eukprot:CAMPEP_0195507848 /NCGR_PEP_ID=MMETSP0794_2-20130614/1213_1 /TAXON_ID=515487 /ORGANISM="Stephanopyxis turris, Strain CCMP 815" /LENGTH=192 /DNA_ID=CAMNT_0040634661 /DNA_START=197 /DNA_END=775 /DNA_ORIENTATION=+